MSHLANNTPVIWTSNKPRVRKARVVTTMRRTRHLLLRVTEGPYKGRCFVVPPERVVPDSQP